ncbi:hypothetical protein GCM10011506_34130 [Marivirga lumbricoides]|uniref:Uncharacterized protein n=1 Tax=Marivirga lumbricoides TaxID=1046115 RepID=A0ABQ1MV94_9BACT|nr:hypothetical protein GCM10011506_34130 [Marivirga lumbricoides]
MADKIVIAELDIDVDALESRQAQLLKQQQAIKDEQKLLQAELKKTGQFTDEQAKAYVKNDAALKNLNQSYQTNKKVLAESTTSIAGLNDALNKQIKTEQAAKDNNRELIRVRGQLDKTSKDYARNLEIINNRIDENNDFIGENVSQLEKQKINIGNYASAIEGATEQLDRMIPGLGQVTKGIATKAKATLASTTATSGATKGLKLFRVALISTGIGAIVVLLGSLVSAFLSTQQGIDAVTSVTRPFFAVLNRLKGLVQELADGAFAGLAMILNGNVKAGLAVIKESFKDTIGGVSEAVKGGIEAGKQLDELSKQIERTEISLIKNRARLNNEFERQKSIAEDVTVSERERIKAAQAAQAAQNDLLNQEQKFLDLKIKRMELEQSLNDTSREDEKELAELIAQRTDFEAAATGKRISVRNLENSIRQGIANQQKARNAELAAEEAKMSAEKLKQLDEERKAAAEKVAEELRLEKEKNEELARIAKDEADRLAAEDKVRKAIEFEEELSGLRAQGASKTAIRLAELDQQRQLEIQAAKDSIQNAELLQRQITLIEEKYSQARTEIKAAEEANELELVSQTYANIATIFGEQTAVGKAAAIAQTTIDTYKAAQSAYAALAGIPFVGPVLGGIAAGAAISTGLRNVAKISGVGLPKFGKGGLQEVGGKSHTAGGTKFYGEDGTAFEAEKGELIGVMNKNAASIFMDYNNKNRNGGYYNPFMDMAMRTGNGGFSDARLHGDMGKLYHAIKSKPVSSTNVDKHGFNQFITDGQNSQKYINKNFLT